MSWRQFLVEIVSKLISWPVIILILLILFHQKYRPFIDNILTNLAERVKALKGLKGPAGLGAEFGDQTKQLEATTPPALLPRPLRL